MGDKKITWPSTARVPSVKIGIWARRLFYAFVGTTVLLIILDVCFTYFRLLDFPQIQRFCNLAREDGVGTYVSVIQFFLIGQVALALGLCQRLRMPHGARAWGWFATAAFFFFLSLDDASLVHERIGSIAKILAKRGDGTRSAEILQSALSAYPSYAWQLTIGPVYLLAGIVLLRFLWKESPSFTAFRIVLTAFALLAVAQGLDFIEGIEGGHRAIENYFSASRYTVRHFFKVVEESLELVAASHFLLGFLYYLESRIYALQFEFAVEK